MDSEHIQLALFGLHLHVSPSVTQPQHQHESYTSPTAEACDPAQRAYNGIGLRRRWYHARVGACPPARRAHAPYAVRVHSLCMHAECQSTHLRRVSACAVTPGVRTVSGLLRAFHCEYPKCLEAPSRAAIYCQRSVRAHRCARATRRVDAAVFVQTTVRLHRFRRYLRERALQRSLLRRHVAATVRQQNAVQNRRQRALYAQGQAAALIQWRWHRRREGGCTHSAHRNSLGVGQARHAGAASCDGLPLLGAINGTRRGAPRGLSCSQWHPIYPLGGTVRPRRTQSHIHTHMHTRDGTHAHAHGSARRGHRYSHAHARAQ